MTGEPGWDRGGPGVIELPSGRLLRGRAFAKPSATVTVPQFGLYLLGSPPPEALWPSQWVRWPDFRLPSDGDAARAALVQAWTRAATERVEVACRGGVGRTGTALACIAVVDGVAASDAVEFVRQHYDPQAVETARQRRFVERFHV